MLTLIDVVDYSSEPTGYTLSEHAFDALVAERFYGRSLAGKLRFAGYPELARHTDPPIETLRLPAPVAAAPHTGSAKRVPGDDLVVEDHPELLELVVRNDFGEATLWILNRYEVSSDRLVELYAAARARHFAALLPDGSPLVTSLRSLLGQGNKIEACKLHMSETGSSLAEAKRFVDALERREA
jgi:hypothetical protein